MAMVSMAAPSAQWSWKSSFWGNEVGVSSIKPRFVVPESLKCTVPARPTVMPIVARVRVLWRRKPKRIHPPGYDKIVEESGLPHKSWAVTYFPTKADRDPKIKKWYIVDATNLVLGRLASNIVYYLRGKDNPKFEQSANLGSYVIVVNCEKVVVTGKKKTKKMYWRHSGRPGGLKLESFQHLQKRIPERIIFKAVKGMLPKNNLSKEVLKMLRVYKGPNHPHEAQNPASLPLWNKRIRADVEEPCIW